MTIRSVTKFVLLTIATFLVAAHVSAFTTLSTDDESTLIIDEKEIKEDGPVRMVPVYVVFKNPVRDDDLKDVILGVMYPATMSCDDLTKVYIPYLIGRGQKAQYRSNINQVVDVEQGSVFYEMVKFACPNKFQ